MATSGDGSGPYEGAGAGGKMRKKSFRRGKPYERPPPPSSSMLKKLVDHPASRLIYAGANRLLHAFRTNPPPPPLPSPEINEEPPHQQAQAATATGISDLELLLQHKTFTRSEIQRLTSVLHSKTNDSHGGGDNSTPLVTTTVPEADIGSPAELAKYYMGSRSTSQPPRQDVPRTSMTPVAQKTADNLRYLENGFMTPRSQGRSAMYTMARTPYSTSPSTFTQQGVKSDYGHGAVTAALTSSQGHGGKMALKRRSSVLDDDIGSGGPLRRIRHKANLLSQRDRKELGYPFVGQPDGVAQNLLLTNEPEPKVTNYASVPAKSTQTANKILQHLDKIEKSSVSTLAGIREKSPNKLRLDMLHGQALRSLEKVDSPKFILPSSNDIQKPVVVPQLTLQSKEETEENSLRNYPVSHNMSTFVNGDTSKDKAPSVEITNVTSKVTEEPQIKHAFQMSAPEDFFEMDDDDDDNNIHDNGHVLLPFVENNNITETSATDIIKAPEILEASKTCEFVVYNKPVFPEVNKVPEERVELKEAEKEDISTPKTDFGFYGSEQGSAFKQPPMSSSSATTTETSELTQQTLQIEKISPLKVSPPFQFSANELSEFKPSTGSDPKINSSISESISVPKCDHVKFSASNKDKNGNWNGNGNDEKKSTNMFGKSESLSPPTVTSTNGVFSFGTSTNNFLNVPNTSSPASSPPTFPSLASVPAAASTPTIATTTTPAVIFSTSVSPPQAFSFVSATSTAPTTSVAETRNISTSSSPFAITTFATTTTTATTTTGSGLFSFSSPAAATSTTTTTGNNLFGFSSPAVATSTITTTGSGPFGFSSPAVATSTTTGSGLFGFSSPAVATSTTTGSGLFGFGSSSPATSTTSTTVSAPFGFSSPAAATTTTSTTSGSALFGFSSPAAATSNITTARGGFFGFSSPATVASSTTTGNGPFGFSSSAPATSTSTTSIGSSPFGFSASAAAATSTTASQSNGSFFNIANGFQASTPAVSSATTLFGSSAPAFGTSSSFGISSVGPTSETKSGTTTSVFGSTWQQAPQKPSSGFGSTFPSSPSSSVFSFGASSTPPSSFVTAGASNSSFAGPSVFGNSNPVFGAISPNNNNDRMSMEDSMAEDSMQTLSPVSPFGQAPVSAPAPGFMFGLATPAPAAAAVPFSFGVQQNQAPPPQNPFQSSSSLEFNAGGGGSFSLGSGGEKSNRRIVRVNKSKNRKK